MKIIKVLIITGLLNFTIACSKNTDEEAVAPFTGNINYEDQVDTPERLNQDGEILSQNEQQPVLQKFAFNKDGVDQATYYIVPVRLRVRSEASTNGEILGVLIRNDSLKVIRLIENTEFAEVEIIKTSQKIKIAKSYYVGKNYISTRKSKAKIKFTKYFMIQNISTEILRIYQRGCTSGSCAHKLILETSMAVGEDKRVTQTNLGHYQISSWHKFYQDGAGKYPSWYDPNYPKLPGPGSSLMTWTSSDLLPYKTASVRGAFGWFTAKVSPNAAAQWTHGTLGWGKDKKQFIDVTRGFWANVFADPRSHGCSRTDNESIAYIRHLLPTNSTIVKVYAKEAYGDKSLSGYSKSSKTWKYILTKNGVRVNGQKADRDQVLKTGTPTSKWIEQGNYKVDAYPTAQPFLEDEWGTTNSDGESGNVYGLEHHDMKGVFLVDEGRLVNYRHPAKLKKGGYSDVRYPSHVLANSKTNYSMPVCPLVYDDDLGDDDWDGDDESSAYPDPRCKQ